MKLNYPLQSADFIDRLNELNIMAQCIPETIVNLDPTPTPGEQLTFNQLKQLPNHNYVWYEVVLGEKYRKPDFIVLDPNYGIWILEVKDWSADSILAAKKIHS